jgi:hypothetical protein
MALLIRLAGAAVLGLCRGGLVPGHGWAAAEHYQGHKFYRIFEGDWLFLFALIAGGCCVRAAVSLLRGSRRPTS